MLAKILLATSLLISIPTKPNLSTVPKPVLPKIPDLFPVDEEIAATLTLEAGKRESKIGLNCKVEKVDEGYVYTYIITNTSDYTLGFRWSILDKVTGTEVMMFMLEPGKSRKVTVESNKPPVYAGSQVQVWLLIKPDDKAWKEDLKKFKATVSGDFFHPVVGEIRGPIPVDLY